MWPKYVVVVAAPGRQAGARPARPRAPGEPDGPAHQRLPHPPVQRAGGAPTGAPRSPVTCTATRPTSRSTATATAAWTTSTAMAAWTSATWRKSTAPPSTGWSARYPELVGGCGVYPAARGGARPLHAHRRPRVSRPLAGDRERMKRGVSRPADVGVMAPRARGARQKCSGPAFRPARRLRRLRGVRLPPRAPRPFGGPERSSDGQSRQRHPP